MSHNGSVVRADDGSIGWTSDAVPAVGAVTFGIDGVLITVDAAFPREVINLVAPDATSLAAVRDLFFDAAPLDILMSAADGDEVTGLDLADTAWRLAVLASVRQFHLGDLDESALTLDSGYGAILAGDTDSADTLYRIGSIGAELIAHDLAEHGCSGAVVEEFAAELAVAPQDSIRADIRAEISRYLEQLAGNSEALWSYRFEEFIEPPAGVLGGPGTVPTRELSIGVINDLLSIPPRLLIFGGPNTPDVVVESTESGAADVSAHLRPTIDENSEEVAELFAVAALRSTGALVSVAPCTVSDGVVTGRVSLAQWTFDDLRFAIVGSRFDPDTLRLDEVGAGLSRVHRYCRHAWTLHRTAAAAVAASGVGSSGAAIDAAREQIGATLTRARASAISALDAIENLISEHEETDVSETLADYSSAVTRLLALIGSDPAFEGPQRPTFAELLAVTTR